MRSSNGSVLIVDDDAGIRRALGSTLAALGYRTDEASNGEHGLDLATRHQYDAILLDINMPGKGGIETCRNLRRELPAVGILMITVRDSEDDKVEALDAGADDFITKPFVIPELTARLRAVRRGRTVTAVKPDLIVSGQITLDPLRRQVTKAGLPVHLTPKEFDVLEYLMNHAGVPVRHDELLRAVWGADYGGEVEYLRTFVRQLRRKIEDVPAMPTYIATEAFIGYRFCSDMRDTGDATGRNIPGVSALSLRSA
jgi:two-component system KDP operon response regulator KdpE